MAEQFATLASTTLNGAITNVVTSIVVTSGASPWPASAQFRIRVDSELMLVTAGAGSTTWTVTRGIEGTTAAAHSTGASVYGVLTAAALGSVSDPAAATPGLRTLGTGSTQAAAGTDYRLAGGGLRPTVADFIEVRGSASTAALTLNQMLLVPLWLPAGTLDQIIQEVTTLGAAGAVLRMGVYADSGSARPTGAALVDGGTVASTTTGNKTVSISLAITGGWYWIGVVAQTAVCTIRSCLGLYQSIPTSAFGSAIGQNSGYTQASVSGALPTAASLGNSVTVPRVGVRYSAVT